MMLRILQHPGKDTNALLRQINFRKSRFNTGRPDGIHRSRLIRHCNSNQFLALRTPIGHLHPD